MFNVGTQLRKTRKKANLTLDQLASSSGVDRGTISRIELGHVSPRIDTISFLCEAMDTDLSAFFGLTEAGAPEAQEGYGGPKAPPANGHTEPLPAEDRSHRIEFPFPMEPAPHAALEGYWPVPSSFWRGLLEVLERFEILVKNSREMILVKDSAGHILYTSPPCEQVLGLRPQDLVGQKIQPLIHPEDLAAYEACVASLSVSPGESRTLTYRMRHRDESWCWISSRLTNQLENPSIRALVVNSLQVQAP
jgi:PAS domain S-box-containing protein